MNHSVHSSSSAVRLNIHQIALKLKMALHFPKYPNSSLQAFSPNNFWAQNLWYSACTHHCSSQWYYWRSTASRSWSSGKVWTNPPRNRSSKGKSQSLSHPLSEDDLQSKSLSSAGPPTLGFSSNYSPLCSLPEFCGMFELSALCPFFRFIGFFTYFSSGLAFRMFGFCVARLRLAWIILSLRIRLASTLTDSNLFW